MLGIFLLVFLIAFGGAFGYAWLRIRQEIHQHFAPSWQALPTPPFPYQTRALKAADGVTTYAWYIPASNAKAVVILAHGLGPEKGRAEMYETAEGLHDAGYSSLLVEMRGVGQSEGNGETLGVKEWQDLAAAYDDMASLSENRGKKIGFLGESMGAATAIMTVGKTGKGDFVLAIVPFANFSKAFASYVKNDGLPAAFIPVVRLAATAELDVGYDQYSPDRLIKNIRVPIFLAWSTHDELIGDNQGEALFVLANEPKVGWAADVGHQLIDESGDAFNQRMFAFLEKYVVSQ